MYEPTEQSTMAAPVTPTATQAPVTPPASQPFTPPPSVQLPVEPTSLPGAQPGADLGPDPDLLASLRQQMQGRLNVPAPQNLQLPDGLVRTSSAPPPPQPPVEGGQSPEDDPAIQRALNEEKPLETPERSPETITPETPTKPKEEPITSLRLDKFGREFSISDLEAAIEGFNYYHPKAMRLQEDLQKLDNARAEFEKSKQSPEFQLTELLKADPALKSKVLDVVRNQAPEGLRKVEDDAAYKSVKTELDQLKAQFEQQAKARQESEIRRRQAELSARNAQARQQHQTHVVTTTQAIDQAVSAKVNELKQQGIELTQDDIRLVSSAAIAEVKSGKLQYTRDSMVPYFNQQLGYLANRLASVRQAAVGNYQTMKQNLPPAPPSGGAPPAIRPDAIPAGPASIQSKLAERIEQALRQL